MTTPASSTVWTFITPQLWTNGRFYTKTGFVWTAYIRAGHNAKECTAYTRNFIRCTHNRHESIGCRPLETISESLKINRQPKLESNKRVRWDNKTNISRSITQNDSEFLTQTRERQFARVWSAIFCMCTLSLTIASNLKILYYPTKGLKIHKWWKNWYHPTEGPK